MGLFNGWSGAFLPPLILNMSITASVMILFVLLARLALRKAPRIFSYALWAVVLFRLLCPVSVTADFSLLGLLDLPAVENTSHTTAVEYIPYDAGQTGNLEVRLPVPPAVNDAVNSALPQEPDGEPLAGTLAVGTLVWLAGIGAMAVYSAVSYLRLRRRLVGAVLLRENIYLADHISSPFVMGLLSPKIYLPSALPERERGYVLLHERHHIRRGDHLIKALAFLALSLHWFNPLVWAAFVLSSRDMEMSCDEAVMKELGEGIRADYSASLLSLATGRRSVVGTPLAFGEGDTGDRIKNLLRWKRPKTWVMLAALAVCGTAMVFCVTNPPTASAEGESEIVWETEEPYPQAVVDLVNGYVRQQIEFNNDLGSGENAISGEYTILKARVVGLTGVETVPYDETRTVGLYRLEYRLLPSEPERVVLAGGMQMEDGWVTEWGSTGQPYLALMREKTGGEDVWTLVGVTNTDSLQFDYGTEELTARYGSPYIAAAMELCGAYLGSDGREPSDGAAEDPDLPEDEPEEPGGPEEPVTSAVGTGLAIDWRSPLNGMFERTYEAQLQMLGSVDQTDPPFFRSGVWEFDDCAVVLGTTLDTEKGTRTDTAYILFRDGALGALPLPENSDGAPVGPASVVDHHDGTLTYSRADSRGTYSYAVNLESRTVGAVYQPPMRTFTPADEEFSDRALGAEPDPMTYEERLALIRTESVYNESALLFSVHQYREGEGCLAYLGEWTGIPHTGQYFVELRFADGSLASLPLPRAGEWESAPPDSMEFRAGKFVYEITFAEDLLFNEGQGLLHLKGTYHYEVDLSAKTVSLTVLQ